jgi:phage gp29-like protein
MARRKKIPQSRFEKWSPVARVDGVKESLDEAPEVNLAGGNHFATRERANDFARLMRSLPDPDPVLRKMGKSITALQELLVDSHLESVWSIRCSAVSGREWFISAGEGGGKKEQEAAGSFAEQLKALDVPRIIEEMMDAVAYGYAPLEILWKPDNGLWGIQNIVGKPPQWFEFDPDNRLVFSGGRIAIEPAPENRFVLVQHKATYLNPYGDKVFSKCFWPAAFKRKGWQWWTVFVEKYGGAFMYGKYTNNASEADKAALMGALEMMIADAVAIAPEGSEITIDSLANKGGLSNVHAEYINAANAEMSKAVLGQTLTTELSGDTGSYAAGQIHNEVREGLALADRRRVSAAFNRLAAVYTHYNFGSGVLPPTFEFVKDKELYAEQAERDVKMYSFGWRPQKTYIMREYGIPEEDFDMAGETESAKEPRFSGAAQARRFANAPAPSCSCGGHTEKKPNFLERLRSLFASKDERAAAKDERLMGEFEEQMLQAGQDELNKIIEGVRGCAGNSGYLRGGGSGIGGTMRYKPACGCCPLDRRNTVCGAGIGGAHG